MRLCPEESKADDMQFLNSPNELSNEFLVHY